MASTAARWDENRPKVRPPAARDEVGELVESVRRDASRSRPVEVGGHVEDALGFVVERATRVERHRILDAELTGHRVEGAAQRERRGREDRRRLLDQARADESRNVERRGKNARRDAAAIVAVGRSEPDDEALRFAEQGGADVPDLPEPRCCKLRVDVVSLALDGAGERSSRVPDRGNRDRQRFG